MRAGRAFKTGDRAVAKLGEAIEHPAHYGGENNPYEAIKVIEAWGAGFCDGNALKDLSRWRQKGGVEDLKKAVWYINRLIEKEEAHEAGDPDPDGA